MKNKLRLSLLILKDWQQIQGQLKVFEQYSTLSKDLQTAFSEVKQFQKGSKKARKKLVS